MPHGRQQRSKIYSRNMGSVLQRDGTWDVANRRRTERRRSLNRRDSEEVSLGPLRRYNEYLSLFISFYSRDVSHVDTPIFEEEAKTRDVTLFEILQERLESDAVVRFFSYTGDTARLRD